MPDYDYRCRRCEAITTRSRRVDERDIAGWCERCCTLSAYRVFTPTANVIVPAHFRIEADWMLPDKDDTAGWEARQGGSTAHAPRQTSFKDEFDRVYKGDL